MAGAAAGLSVMALVELGAKVGAASLVSHRNVAAFYKKAKALAVGLESLEGCQACVGPFGGSHFGLDLRVKQDFVALKLGVVVGLKVGVGGLFKFGRLHHWRRKLGSILLFSFCSGLGKSSSCGDEGDRGDHDSCLFHIKLLGASRFFVRLFRS